MSLSKYLARLNSDALRTPILKMLYRKNGLVLSYFKSYNNNRFFIYCVNGVYVAFESLNWFINIKEFEKHCHATSLSFYEPQDGDTIVDIGAGLGEEAIIYSNAVGVSGRVLAVEANPHVYQVLSDVVNLNKLSNVDVINIALSPTEGGVTINDEMETYLSGSIHHTETASKIFRVEGMPLSELLKRYDINKVDLLKVNIEGAERFLAEETSPEIFDNVRNVAISCHDFRFRKEGREFFRTKELIAGYFEGIGYQLKSQSTGIDFIDDWIYGVRN